MRYDDILHAERPEPKTMLRMSRENRAAQFAPYSALTGYGEAVAETARTVDRKISLSEDEKQLLSEKTAVMLDNPDEEYVVTYFVPDGRKSGGQYVTKRAAIKRFDETEREIVFADNARVKLDDVLDINADILCAYFG